MKGENIFKRKDGRWEARYIRERDIYGKIVYGFCYGKTYKEAKDKASELKSLGEGLRPVKTPLSRRRLAVFCDEWLCSCRVRLKSSTCCRYETAVEKHIKPRLGSLLPASITDGIAADFTAALLSEGLSPKTVRDILAVLRLILRYVSKRLPGGLGEIALSAPKEQRKEARVLSLEEQERFVSYLVRDLDCCKFGVLLAMFTGLRIGELCALRWKNISLKDRTVRVDSAMQRIKNDGGESRTKIVVGSPKSDLSYRVIPLSESAARLCAHMEPDDRSCYILTGTQDFLEPRTLQYRLKKYAKDCGLEGVHFHTLRHTFATRCVEVGFEIKSLSEILGHATTVITMERYVHSSLSLKRENMQKLTAVGM